MAVKRRHPRMKRTQVCLLTEDFERAQELARKRGVSLSQVVREGLGCVLERAADEDEQYYAHMLRLTGIVEGADPDGSEKVDEMIYGPDIHR